MDGACSQARSVNKAAKVFTNGILPASAIPSKIAVVVTSFRTALAFVTYQDGYNSEAWLVFDIDEVNGTGEDVFVEISQRETGTTNFIPLVKTTPFNVVSDAADARGIRVTDFSNFDEVWEFPPRS